MENKRIGIIIIILSIIIMAVLFSYASKIAQSSRELGCFQNEECLPVESSLSITHVAFGVMGFLFSLGFYLIFFTKGEEAIVQRLEEEKKKSLSNEKFNILLNALDPYEKKVLIIIKNQPGITQNTLRLKSDISKTKLSYVINELEKRNLIKRETKDKTFAIYFKMPL